MGPRRTNPGHQHDLPAERLEQGPVSDTIDEPERAEITAAEMVEDLASDHERIAHRLHALIELIDGRKDPVTEDLATERSAFHESAAWMLRSIAKS